MEHFVLLSGTINIDGIINDAEDIAAREYLNEYSGDEILFDISEDQKSDLEKVIIEAVNKWQSKHNLIFKSQIFHKVSEEQVIHSINKTK